MKASELRELTVDELNSKHQELKEEFMRIRCNTVLSADSDVHQMRKTRKDIARINTILNAFRIVLIRAMSFRVFLI